MYEYQTPTGYGDTFFVYNFNGEDIPLANGNDYTLVGVTIDDGMFVCRVWSGGALIVDVTTGTVQMYDGVKNAWFLYQPILVGSMFPPSLAVTPEKVYRDNSAFRFDLTDVALTVNTNGSASVYADQMAWYGVKRNPGNVNDPLPSTYKYYEKPFAYPVTITLDDYGPSDVSGNPIPGLAAPTQYQQLIQDYDFELRRITVAQASSAGSVDLAGEGEGVIRCFGTVGVGVGTFDDNAGTPNQPMTVTVVGNQIKLEDSTDAFGNPSGTAAQAVSLMQSTPAVTALVSTVLIIAGSVPITNSYSIISGSGGGLLSYASPFKILLYDATWRQRSTIPLLSELMCYTQNTSYPKSTMPNNNWPSPPLMYPVNSVIRFDIFSLIPTGDALPISIQLLFEGIRRIAC